MSRTHISWRSIHFLNAAANLDMTIPFVAHSQVHGPIWRGLRCQQALILRWEEEIVTGQQIWTVRWCPNIVMIRDAKKSKVTRAVCSEELSWCRSQLLTLLSTFPPKNYTFFTSVGTMRSKDYQSCCWCLLLLQLFLTFSFFGRF